ncbi:MAG: hypothetical protein Q7S57_06030 [bacterium]|nr:hypothetical protein [bacterium]
MICRQETASGQSYEQLLEILSEEGALRIITPHRYVRVLRTAKDLCRTQCTRCGRYFIYENMDGSVSLDKQDDAFVVHCDDCKAVIDGVEDLESGFTLESHRSQKRLRRKERRARHNGYQVEEYIDYSDGPRGRLVKLAKTRLVRSNLSSRH